jgi:hypothetical protein
VQGISLRYGNQSDKVEPWLDQWGRGLRSGESQWEKGRPQPGQKVGGKAGIARTCKGERKGNGPYQGPMGISPSTRE